MPDAWRESIRTQARRILEAAEPLLTADARRQAKAEALREAADMWATPPGAGGAPYDADAASWLRDRADAIDGEPPTAYPCDAIRRLCDALDAAEQVIADAKAECLRQEASWSEAANTSTRARLDAVLAILSGPDGEATDG